MNERASQPAAARVKIALAVILVVGGLILARGGFSTRTPAPAPAVRFILSVDWEGRNLAEENLAAMEAFRASFPQLKLTQFLNAAYFTKRGASAELARSQIRRGIRAGDELALHIHAWRSLVEAAGAGYRDQPTFWGGPAGWPDDTGDVGHEVELPAYSLEELRAMVATSVRILSDNGFALSQSFRAGGWLADETVLQAIRLEGFTVDSSASDATWHDEIASYPLRQRIRELWPQVTPETQPFTIRTPAGPILEVPDSGAMADYVTADEMVAHLRDALQRHERQLAAWRSGQPAQDTVIQLGFHQETAAKFLPSVALALRRVDLGSHGGIVSSTVSELAPPPSR